MTINQIKRVASDCRTTSRWVTRYDRGRLVTSRLIGVGRKYIRVMEPDGRISSITPCLVTSAW